MTDPTYLINLILISSSSYHHYLTLTEEMARHLEDIRLENMRAEDDLERNSHHLTREEEEARLLVVNAKDLRDGRTALHVAAARGDLAAVKQILGNTRANSMHLLVIHFLTLPTSPFDIIH